MSMWHKAYIFDWQAFERDPLYGLLLTALKTDDPADIARYIDIHRGEIKDPYEGESLGLDWQNMLENRDVNEYGDFALTRFYDPAKDRGIAGSWLGIDARLKGADRMALLGFVLGEPARAFDPGRQGSYFQTPDQVLDSLQRVERLSFQMGELQSFKQLLLDCTKHSRGLYVTF